MKLPASPTMAQLIEYETQVKASNEIVFAWHCYMVSPRISTLAMEQLYELEHFTRMIANAVHTSALFPRRLESRIRS